MSGQAAFAGALMDGALPAPDGLVAPGGSPAGRRFDVYRNNVVSGLCDALELGFPVVARLVGTEFFRALAGAFARAHPPRSPVLSGYGEAFPAFLSGFPTVAHLPYLPDMARLELALRRAYHAADPAPFDPAALAALTAADLDRTCLVLAPAVRVVSSPFPIHGIWLLNTETSAHRPDAGAQDVLVSRPGFDPQADLMAPGAAPFLAAIHAGVPFGIAAEGAAPDFDLPGCLTLLLARGAIAGLIEVGRS